MKGSTFFGRQKGEKTVKERRLPFFAVGVIVLLALALTLLWTQSSRSNQATKAVSMGIRFDGEYRISDGEWKPVTAGEHISATKGNVTLRGVFSLLEPFDEEYIGSAGQGVEIALYLNHIGCEIREPGFEPYDSDAEQPGFGDSACGRIWTAYELRGDGQEPITIRLHNPHRLGNETAVDDFLENLAIYRGAAFEKQMAQRYELERTLGLVFALSAFAIFGISLFSAQLQLPQNRFFWQIAFLSLFAGGYFLYAIPTISFQSWLIALNTTIPGLCMMFYMLFLTDTLVPLMAQEVQKIGTWTVCLLGVVCGAGFLLPIVSSLRFYDTTMLWAAVQCAACLVVAGCLLWQFGSARKPRRWMRLGGIALLLAYVLDFAALIFGWWQDGAASRIVFVATFAGVMVWALRTIPRMLQEAARAKDLEGELRENRMAIMMSQIKPHFIYNTLGSIEQLCTVQPEAAAELVHNFSRFLRGNLGELDNPAPVRLSQELEHVRCYVSIEKARFPDITVSFDLRSEDFLLPALSVQPLVENAIKHGLMQLPQGGTVTISTFETDTDYCVQVRDTGGGFDIGKLWEDSGHVGLRNIRTRVEAMCGGRLTVESTVGLGTTATMQIPREGAR